MADDASLERFLVAAAALKDGAPLDLRGMFELLRAMREEGDETLAEPLDVAMEAILAALGASEPRSAALACYAFERVTIDVESRLRSAALQASRRTTGFERPHLRLQSGSDSIAYSVESCNNLNANPTR